MSFLINELFGENKRRVRPYIEIKDGVLVKYLAAEDEEVVKIPNGVEVIAENAFAWNGAPEDQAEEWEYENDQIIREIQIPASVKRIEGGAFRSLFYLKRIEIHPDCPAGIMIDGVLFSRDMRALLFHNYSATGKYAIPDGVKVIEKGAFEFCRDCEDLIIPNTVERIEDYAFNDSFVKHLNIPESVVFVGANAFLLMHFMEPDRISVDQNNPALLKNDFGVFSKDGKRLMIAFVDRFGEYTVPDGVTEIAESVFLSSFPPVRVTLPDSMEILSADAFGLATRLEDVHMPDSIREIGVCAFDNCHGLKKVRISKALTKIGDGAFQYCSELKSLHLPASLCEIGQDAFCGCKNLIIKAPAGSYAIEYAKNHGIEYKEI